VAISSSAENQRLHLVACQSDTTGAFATAESGVRRLTQAAIEKLPLRKGTLLQRFGQQAVCSPRSKNGGL
jgi:hypothetical protein